MTNRHETRSRLRATINASLAALVVGAISAGAHAAVMSSRPGTGLGGGTNWLDQLTEDGPAGSLPLPGGFSIDNGEPDKPPPDYRAHSDVPDLPDGGTDPNATSNTGTSLYTPPRTPRLRDTWDPNIQDSMARTQSTLPLDSVVGGSGGTLAPASPLVVPTPGALMLLGAAGLGAAGRRRRR